MRATRWPLLILLFGLAVLGAAAGCGDDADDDDSNDRADLIDRLPDAGGGLGVTVVDVQAAREALGLSGDVEPTGDLTEPGSDEMRFSGAVEVVIPFLGFPLNVRALEAIDLTRVTAAANNGPLFGGKGVVVLETDQPFDEVAEALEQEGYERAGDVLTTEGEKPSQAPTVVASADSTIAMGWDRKAVVAAANGETETVTSPDRQLAGELDAPVVAAMASRGCVDAIAVADFLVDRQGELVVETSDPDPERLDVDAIGVGGFASPQVGDPSVDGNRLTAPFTWPADHLNSPLMTIVGNPAVDQYYRC